MQTMQYTFRLFGAHKGRTMTINGHHFVNGELSKVLSGSAAGTLCKVLSYYGAYAKGTPEYEAALAQEQEESNGASGSKAASGAGSPTAVQRDVQSKGPEPAETSANVSEKPAAAAEGGSGSSADGDGHGDSGVLKFEEAETWPKPSEPLSVGSDAVAVAIRKLDPENSKHWVQTGVHKGLPKLSAVEQAYGKSGLTRQDLEAALPGWNRDKALDEAMADL